MEGWVSISRQIREHWIYQDAEYLKVWMEMLFLARFSHESSTEMIEGQLVEMHYGQFIFGRIKWSERLGISERRLRTLMDKLIADNMIYLVKRAPKFSIYCVTNLSKYRPSSDHQEIKAGQGFDILGDQQNVQQTTSKRPASDQQATTKEQSKQRKQSNNVNKKIHYAEFVQLTPEEYEKLVSQYGEEMTLECINILNTYKGSTGKKYRSDYMTMTPSSWVPKRYYEDQEKKLRVVNGGQYRGKPNTMARLDELYKKAVEEEKEREASGHY